ncbi:MAG: hypothetical protein ACKVH8_10890 [Pirellulales bacterium]
MTSKTTETRADRQWYIVRRWQTYSAELRTILIRMLAVMVFYSLQLGHHYGILDDAGQADNLAFHQAATGMACAWLFMSLGIFLLLQKKIFPPVVPYISTLLDVLLLTVLLILAGGPNNAQLVTIYYVIIVMAGLRFDLRLIWVTIIACFVGYLAAVGAVDKVWFDADHAVAPIRQVVTLASMGTAGICVGQMIRRTRQLADEYRKRMEQSGSGEPS